VSPLFSVTITYIPETIGALEVRGTSKWAERLVIWAIIFVMSTLFTGIVYWINTFMVSKGE
jgi:hypothetical protein